MEENMIVVRDTKTFYFDFHCPKAVDGNLKHKIAYIIKSNGYLAKNKIKNDIKQSLFKYKHGNNIHEHRKHQNE